MVVKYPHMLPVEIELWDWFLATHPGLYEKYEYDVHVGKGVEIPPDTPKNIAEMSKKLTQKRIDAVGYKEGEIGIFEVKPYAGASALGQLLTYKALFIEERRPKEMIKLYVVTDRLSWDMDRVFHYYRVDVFSKE
jgi:hypothetical protein